MIYELDQIKKSDALGGRAFILKLSKFITPIPYSQHGVKKKSLIIIT